jgi:E3 ubiquitin-protein ligase HERC3
MGANLAFVELGDMYVVRVEVGSKSTCVLATGGRLKCWGLNTHGRLGLSGENDDVFVDFGEGRTVLSMTVMSSSVCALLDNQQVKCFGQNNYGQLGYGDIFDRGTSIATMGSALPAVDLGTNRHAVRLFPSSSDTICALLNTAEVKCWGSNKYLALGMGLQLNQNIGDEKSEMGDNLVAIAVPTGRTVKNLWVSRHVVAILDDDTMIAWGGVHL